MIPKRPHPVPSPETAPFWEGAARGALSLPFCGKCERCFFPPSGRCSHCLSEKVVWRDVSGQGRLRSWTALSVPTFVGAREPLLVAEVEPDEGDGIMLPMLAEAEESRLFVDCRVWIDFVADEEGWTWPVAKPLDAGEREAAHEQ